MATFGEMIRSAYAKNLISNMTLLDANLRDENTDAAIVLDRMTGEMVTKLDKIASREDGQAVFGEVMALNGWLKALSAEHAQRIQAAMMSAAQRVAGK